MERKHNKQKVVVCTGCGRKFLALRADAKFCNACSYERRLKKNVEDANQLGEGKAEPEATEPYIEQIPLKVDDATEAQAEKQNKPGTQFCSICGELIERSNGSKYHYCPKHYKVMRDILDEGKPTQYKGKADELFEATKRRVEAEEKTQFSCETQEPEKAVPDSQAKSETDKRWDIIVQLMREIAENQN